VKEKKKGTRRGNAGCSTVPESAEINDGIGGLRRLIATAWWRFSNGKRREERGGARSTKRGAR
jgi:hypothetical protein